jgi:hypothetical protein
VFAVILPIFGLQFVVGEELKTDPDQVLGVAKLREKETLIWG